MPTTYQAKLISPGKGTSGYYPASTLKQAVADGVFPRGTKMYWTNRYHESKDGDLNLLAGVLAEDGTWQERGKDGPGIYAPVEIFSDFETKVKEKGPYIGLSILGDGDVAEGEADGYRGLIVKRIHKSDSVDFVPKAGRDGKVIFESASLPDGHTILQETIRLMEMASVADWLESRLHLQFTNYADDMFGEGYLTRQERMGLSSAISAALNAFRRDVEKSSPGLLERSRWQEPKPMAAETAESEGDIHMATLQEAEARLAEMEKRNAGLEAELKRLQAQATIHEAERIAGKVWDDGKYGRIPAEMRRLFESNAVLNVPLTADGKLDAVKLTTGLQEAADTYLKTLPAGVSVEGQGGNGGVTLDKLTETAVKRLMDRTPGLTEAQARRIVEGM